MNIDITSLLERDCFALSHSRMEGGQDAGYNTWNASKEQANETPLLDTHEKLQAMRDFARSSGGWDNEEIAAWDSQEINDLFLQWIAGDVRQLPAKLDGITFSERPDGWYRENDAYEWGPYESRTEAYQDFDTRLPYAENLDEVDWEEAEIVQSEGQAPSNLFRGDDGAVYFYLGE